MKCKFLILSLAVIVTSCAPETKDGNNQSISDNISQVLETDSETTVDLTKHGIANNKNNVLGGLMVGDLAPDIELEDERGTLISLDKKLEEGPVLLVFYRADWCSICRRHLAEFQDKINDIRDTGVASVLAISPQKQEYSL